MESRFFDRDISWLGFNYRVLKEAADETVPLMERLKFLSIYSANLDEFYRVRMPALQSLKNLESDNAGLHYATVIASINNIIIGQMKALGAIITNSLLPKLKEQKIHLIYNESIPHFLLKHCTAYFYNQVAGFLQPVFLREKTHSLVIENNKLQLLVVLANNKGEDELAILNIPADFLPRFYFMDDDNTGTRFIIFLDDIIKANLDKIFTGYSIRASYSFKITRDAALDLYDEFDEDIAASIERQLKKRDKGIATRFLYQPGIPLHVLYSVIDKLNLTNASIVAGGNYHSLKNLSALPLGNQPHFFYEDWPPVNKEDQAIAVSVFNTLAAKDIIVHTPYQSYYPVLRFFNEAAIDSSVEEIYITIYRVAQNSIIVNSLISAAKNGKKVTVFVELKARFDEENNLKWAGIMKEAGVKIIYSIAGLKVHAKVALVKRRESNRLKYYGLFSTGNFNEITAGVYTDHVLLTAKQGMVAELELLFIFLSLRMAPKKYGTLHFQHLLVAQFNLQSQFLLLIDKEIALATQGVAATITIKVNSLEDRVMITKLCEASNAGVQIKLIIRGICCLIPGVENMSKNIEVIRIVDRYLEHGRLFVFGNNGFPLLYMGSSDWMNKSMHYRIEVCFPVYDEKVKATILQLINIQLADNVKGVKLNECMQNIPVGVIAGEQPVRSQKEIYDLLNG